MGESYGEAHFAILLRFVLYSYNLDRTDERHKPSVIVPGALVLGIREICMFETGEVFRDDFERQTVGSRFFFCPDRRHKFASVVPGRIVGEVFLDDGFGHVALLLQEFVLQVLLLISG